MKMGLMDKLNNDANLTRSSQPMKQRKEDEGRGQLLLDSIEEHGVPDNVILLTENAYRRGGRQIGASLVGAVFGSMFFLLPIGLMIVSLFGDAFVLVPCLGIFGIPFFWFGSRLAGPAFQNLTNPDPPEDVVEMLWYDSRHRFLAGIEHTSDAETGQEYYPELSYGIYLKDGDEIAILYDTPSEGGMTNGDRRVCLWDPQSELESYVVLNLQWFGYYEEEEARERARFFARKLRLRFEHEENEITGWNMEVVNPGGGFLITRGSP
tara:strand:+ start:3247 stop:4041 length:795 start_codon:yes stop_codon:yes gene_type:complete